MPPYALPMMSRIIKGSAQLLHPGDAKYEEQMVKGVHGLSVQLACGDVVSPMVVFWSFTKQGSLIPRAVAISNGIESKVEKASVVLGQVSLRNGTLEVRDLQTAAEGHFMCQAMYEEEEEIRVGYFYIELVVLGKGQLELHPITDTSLCDVALVATLQFKLGTVPVSKPFLQMNNSTPVEGMAIMMTCSVKEGTPPLRYSWHHYTSRDSTGTVAETASGPANRTHMGWYTCTALNEINSQTSEPMYLDVIYGPDEPVISIEPFAINHNGFSANEQEEVIMTCLASSNPPSHYLWFYNSSQVYSGQKYVIAKISRTQTGTYTCLAQNIHLNTRTQTTIILTVYLQLRWVKSSQEANTGVAYSNATSIQRGMDIQNGSMYTCLAFHPGIGEKAVCKTTVWAPAGNPTCSAMATKQNEFLMLSCNWQGGMPRVTLWWRDWRNHVLGGLKQSSNIYVMKSNSSLGGKEFTCIAAHPLRARAIECRIQLEAPRLVAESTEVSLFEGDEVQLGCMLQGPHLGSEVFWYNNKNQVIRPDAQKYRLQQSGTWFKLTVRDTEWPSDSGIYRCAAVNAVGNTSLPISLHVKKYPVPPNVTISKLMYTRQRTEVQLEWVTQGSGNLTGFMVQRRDTKRTFSNSSRSVDSLWETVASDIEPDIRDHRLGGLDPAMVYAFRILAVNHRTTGHPSEMKTPADPPFNAYPAVIGAAVAGMIVATVLSLLVFQYIIRNRANNPKGSSAPPAMTQETPSAPEVAAEDAPVEVTITVTATS
ncbi:V-set and immunoglobulin domain-containing protein 10-like 2 [Alligator sinensis]|uniref:V-set and immunoglobulin domain-containing protein 10-like 2 n=1 Tax=Alligator sinensis TaxID=38654 RepID=UPI0003C2716E|nr:V-set and immunoglobulin domain-containing protein 10-like 2 [Alligator sinensis]